jgi:hypothetical protein
MGNRIEEKVVRVSESPLYFTSAEAPAKTAEVLRAVKIEAAPSAAP